MKIGILSMQRIKNSGSFLQGFALKKEIEKLGHEVEWVDYFIVSNNHEITSRLSGRVMVKKYLGKIKRKILGIISDKSSRRYYAEKMIEKNHNEYDMHYYNDLGMKSFNQYHPDIDMLVIGSDEVFNLIQFIEEFHTNIPWEMYGYGFEDIKVVSYAASCGSTTIDKIKQHGLYEKSVECLSKFSSISVRDKNTKQCIESMGLSCETNIDPVLLYDFKAYELPQVNIKDYIIVYAYNFRFNDEEKKAIRTYADSKGKKLVCVNEQQDFCDENLVVHPLEMLSYFKYADYVITDTFHGAVISMKYHKTFGAFIRESNKQKLGYLLEHFDMESRAVKSPENLKEVMETPINYKRFDEILLNEREKSHSYLKNVLEIKE